jgi:hypothetical protein
MPASSRLNGSHTSFANVLIFLISFYAPSISTPASISANLAVILSLTIGSGTLGMKRFEQIYSSE